MRPAAKMPKLTRRSRIWIAVAVAAVLLLLIGPRFVDTYVDWLWFGELGYRSVWTTQVVTRLVIFLVVTALVLVYHDCFDDSDNDASERPPLEHADTQEILEMARGLDRKSMEHRLAEPGFATRRY